MSNAWWVCMFFFPRRCHGFSGDFVREWIWFMVLWFSFFPRNRRYIRHEVAPPVPRRYGGGGALRKGRFGGLCTRRCIHKAVHTQGGLWPLQEFCYLVGVRGLAPHQAKRAVCRAQRAEGYGGGYGGGGFVRTIQKKHPWGNLPCSTDCHSLRQGEESTWVVNEPLFGCFDSHCGVGSLFSEQEMELRVENLFRQFHLVEKKIILWHGKQSPDKIAFKCLVLDVLCHQCDTNRQKGPCSVHIADKHNFSFSLPLS